MTTKSDLWYPRSTRRIMHFAKPYGSNSSHSGNVSCPSSKNSSLSPAAQRHAAISPFIPSDLPVSVTRHFASASRQSLTVQASSGIVVVVFSHTHSARKRYRNSRHSPRTQISRLSTTHALRSMQSSIATITCSSTALTAGEASGRSIQRMTNVPDNSAQKHQRPRGNPAGVVLSPLTQPLSSGRYHP